MIEIKLIDINEKKTKPETDVVFGPWVNCYPCQNSYCNNILSDSAFTRGSLYKPCKKCGYRFDYTWAQSGRKKYEVIYVKTPKWKKIFYILVCLPFPKYRSVLKFVSWEIK